MDFSFPALSLKSISSAYMWRLLRVDLAILYWQKNYCNVTHLEQNCCQVITGFRSAFSTETISVRHQFSDASYELHLLPVNSKSIVCPLIYGFIKFNSTYINLIIYFNVINQYCIPRVLYPSFKTLLYNILHNLIKKTWFLQILSRTSHFLFRLPQGHIITSY